MSKGLKFGFFGLGQGGNNTVNEMAKHAPEHVYAIGNIAGVDLDTCESIAPENRIKIGDREGAGKDIKVGREEVLNHKEYIKRKIGSMFSGCDMPYIVGSGGGGFGTWGSLTVSAIMAQEMQLPHNIVYITARHNEGLIEQKNLKNGLIYLKHLTEESRNLKNVMIVDNERLIEFAKSIAGEGGLWEKANKEISSRIQCAYKYTLRPSSRAIDPNDYKKVMSRKGLMTVIETAVEITDATTNQVLVSTFHDMLTSDYSSDFMVAGDLTKAEAIAVFIEREQPFPGEDDAIELLKDSMKSDTTAILRPVGIYEPRNAEEKNSFSKALSFLNREKKDTKKMLKMTVVFAGMPFPDQIIDDLEQRIQDEEKQLLENRGNQEKKIYKISKEDIKFLEEVNTVEGVKEESDLLQSDLFADVFDFADDADLDGLKSLDIGGDFN